VPVACGVLGSSNALSNAAVKTLISVGDPAAVLYLYSALRSENGTIAAAAWNVFDSVAAPYQAGMPRGSSAGAMWATTAGRGRRWRSGEIPDWWA